MCSVRFFFFLLCFFVSNVVVALGGGAEELTRRAVSLDLNAAYAMWGEVSPYGTFWSRSEWMHYRPFEEIQVAYKSGAYPFISIKPEDRTNAMKIFMDFIKQVQDANKISDFKTGEWNVVELSPDSIEQYRSTRATLQSTNLGSIFDKAHEHVDTISDLLSAAADKELGAKYMTIFQNSAQWTKFCNDIRNPTSQSRFIKMNKGKWDEQHWLEYRAGIRSKKDIQEQRNTPSGLQASFAEWSSQ